MKNMILAVLLVLGFAGEAWAASQVNTGATVKLPVAAKIVNLALMPVGEAIAFCDQRALACPAIREKYAEQQDQFAGERAAATSYASSSGQEVFE